MATMKKKSKGIISWPEEERPRERLLTRGPQALTDAELIAILIRVGYKGTSAVELGRQVIKRFGSLRALVEAPVIALLDVKGLKGAKAAQLTAAMEIARRVVVPTKRSHLHIKGTSAAADYLRGRLNGLAEEQFRILYLNRRKAMLNDVLIAQGSVDSVRPLLRSIMVLGRGLRRPEGWQGEDPIVTVFNHDAWSGRIKHLVNEILEVERRLASTVDSGSPYNFGLHNLDYTRTPDTSEYAKKGEYRLFEDGFVDLPTQVEAEDVSVEFERAVTGEHVKFNTRILHKTYSVEDVADRMFRALEAIDRENAESEDPKDHTNYAKKFSLEKCEEIVRDSLKRAKIKTGRVTEDNQQRFLQALGTLRRKKAKRVVYKMNPKALVTLSTSERQADSCSAAELRRGAKTVFYGPDTEATLKDEQVEFFKEVQDPDGEFRAGREAVLNSHDFKTPLNLAIADAMPERRFVRQLCARENAQAIDAWLKNTSIRFYSIEFAWKKGEHPKRGEFSPDFFIKAQDMVLVVEIKDDSEILEPSPENQKKYEYAKVHFERLNEWLQNEGVAIRYQFNFLTPRNYGAFFQKLREKDLEGFRSELDVALSKSAALQPC